MAGGGFGGEVVARRIGSDDRWVGGQRRQVGGWGQRRQVGGWAAGGQRRQVGGWAATTGGWGQRRHQQLRCACTASIPAAALWVQARPHCSCSCACCRHAVGCTLCPQVECSQAHPASTVPSQASLPGRGEHPFLFLILLPPAAAGLPAACASPPPTTASPTPSRSTGRRRGPRAWCAGVVRM